MSRELNILDKTISPRRMVWMLAWPTVVEQLLMSVVTYVDAAMVGSAGVNATAAIAVNTSFIWLINGLVAGLGVGASVLVAKKIGERNLEEARDILRQAILAMLVMGLFLSLLGQLVLAPYLATWMGAEEVLIEPAGAYMRVISLAFAFQVFLGVGGAIIRGTGDTRTPMIYNILNNVFNVVGNFLFIYPTRTISLLGLEFTMWGAGLGSTGAAIGTALAFAISGSLTMMRLFSRKSMVGISLKDSFRLDRQWMGQIIGLGIPSAFERVTLSAGQLVITSLATGMGSSVLAAHQLANTAESICYMPAFGFNVAVTTLVAQSLGAGEKKMARDFAWTCIKYSVAIMIGCASLMYIFAPQMIGFFIKDAAVISLGSSMLRIIAFAEPCVAIATVVPGILKGAGDTRWPFYISIIGMWCVRLTLAMIMIKGFGAGLEGIWIPMSIDWTVRTLIGLWLVRGGKWMDLWDRKNENKEIKHTDNIRRKKQ